MLEKVDKRFRYTDVNKIDVGSGAKDMSALLIDGNR